MHACTIGCVNPTVVTRQQTVVVPIQQNKQSMQHVNTGKEEGRQARGYRLQAVDRSRLGSLALIDHRLGVYAQQTRSRPSRLRARPHLWRCCHGVTRDSHVDFFRSFGVEPARDTSLLTHLLHPPTRPSLTTSNESLQHPPFAASNIRAQEALRVRAGLG